MIIATLPDMAQALREAGAWNADLEDRWLELAADMARKLARVNNLDPSVSISVTYEPDVYGVTANFSAATPDVECPVWLQDLDTGGELYPVYPGNV